jgi:ankyrin repeat protein
MLTRSPGVANCLLDHGADIEREANDCSCVLELACTVGGLAVVRVFLKRGAVEQILKASTSGHTPLSVAANNKHDDVTLLLLKHLVLQPSFDINNPRLAKNQPLLCCAAVKGLCRVAEFALNYGADPNITGPIGPPLTLAVKSKHSYLVDLLCQKGANVNIRYNDYSCLDEAVLRVDAKIANSLINYGADVNACSKHPSAVMLAAVLGECGLVRLLLDAGATLNADQQCLLVTRCCSALNDAAAVKVMRLLLPQCSSFADSNHKPAHQLLGAAVTEGRLQEAKLLHYGGVDVRRAAQDCNLMHYAAASGNLAVVKWLQSLGLDTRVLSAEQQLLPLHYASKRNHMDIAVHLSACSGAAEDMHAQSLDGLTPLHYAAAYKADSVVQLLLQRRADANVADHNGTTPLMMAKSLAVVKLLLAAGADATAVDNRNYSALHHHAISDACAGTVCLLLQAGANPRAVNGCGNTAAHLAGVCEHLALEALLSRAADDYRKKYGTVSSMNDDVSSNSSDSSESVASQVRTSSSDHSDSTDINSSKATLNIRHSNSLPGVVTDTCDNTTATFTSNVASDNGEHCATTTATKLPVASVAMLLKQ